MFICAIKSGVNHWVSCIFAEKMVAEARFCKNASLRTSSRVAGIA